MIMTPLMLAAALFADVHDTDVHDHAPEVDPVVFYWQGVHCAGASLAEQDAPDSTLDDQARLSETLAWGMAMSVYGPQAGRTAEQVDGEDVARPRVFFTLLRQHNRVAFDAQRAYCRALMGGGD